jgi:hypothetical protein
MINGDAPHARKKIFASRTESDEGREMPTKPGMRKHLRAEIA